MTTEVGKQIVKRLEGLKRARDVHVPTWQSCFDYTIPILGEGFYSEHVTASSSRAKQAKIMDNTATQSVRELASQIVDGMTPANALWFDLHVPDASQEEKRWLRKTSEFMWENIHMSNFDAENFEAVLEVLIAGWFCLYLAEGEGGYSFEQWPISQVFAASTRSDRRVDTVYRVYKLTADQAHAEFEGNVSEDIVKCREKDKGHEEFCFIHAIEPRVSGFKGATLAKDMLWSSYHCEEKTGKVNREGGYHEFPCAVPRWMVIPQSVYGLGPIYEALADISTVNEIKRLELANLDMAIAGMWIAEDDGVLNPRTVTIGARKVIVANSVDSMRELRSGSDFNTAFVSEDRLQNQIKRSLNADQLPPLEGQPRTALEISERTNMIRQMQGPIFGRFQSEYLQTMIERAFGIAYRAGVLPEVPTTLANRSFNIQYMSPIARAQRLESVNAIDRLILGAMETAEAFPGALDKIDMDQAMDYKAEAMGVPVEVIRSSEAANQVRQQRAQEQQQAQEQAIGNEVTMEAGKQQAKAMAGAAV